jgi:cytochrome c5
MSQEQDREFFRKYSIVIGIIAVAMVIFYVIANSIGGRDEEYTTARAEQTAENTAPVAQVNVAGEAPAAADPAAADPAVATATTDTAPADGAAAAGDDAGKSTYDGLCVSCHGSGLPNVPQMGDKAAWEPRIAQGMDVLYTHAIGGFVGPSGMPMPAKGGNPALTDDQVKAAVDHMVAGAK